MAERRVSMSLRLFTIDALTSAIIAALVLLGFVWWPAWPLAVIVLALVVGSTRTCTTRGQQSPEP